MARLRNSYFSYFLMYSFYYLSWALFSALISVYLLDKGLLKSEVSLIVSASFLASMLLQPVVGMLSDKFDTKKVNIVLFALAAVGGLFFAFANNFWTMLIGYSFVLALVNSTNPVMEKIATASPYQYGKIRIWGTIGYALGSQLAGIIFDVISPRAVFLTFIGTMVLTIFGTYFTEPELKQKEEVEVTVKEDTKPSSKGLFTNKKYLYFLLITCIFTAATSMANTYVPAMFVEDGMSVSTSSTILALAVFCETPLVLFSSKFMDKLTNKTLLMIAYTMVVVQFAVYAFDLPLLLKIIATLVAKHPAGMLFIMINLKVIHTIIDEDRIITALAFVATAKNLVSIAGQNVAGQLLDTMSYANVFFIFFILLCVGMALTAVYKIDKGTNFKLFS